MVFFTIHLSTLALICLRRAQGESKSGALPDLQNKVIAQNLILFLRKARPGTQRDRPLMRPVTAPCDQDPPTRFPVGTRSPRLDPPDKASDRTLMRPVTVALSSLPCPETVLRSYRYDCPSLSRAGGAKRAAGPGPNGPSEHRDRGAKVTRRISGESEPRVRRASESLSVTLVPDQQRRAFREAVCEERAGAAAGAGASRQARGVILPTGQLREKQGRVCERSGTEGSEASGSAAETNSLDRYSCQQNKFSLGKPTRRGAEPR